jgi:DNA-directed RNA polymerase specialized sigma24 family protein
VTEKTTAARPEAGAGDRTAIAAFERLYRANVQAVMAYFARRSGDPNVVADLTADTFVAVITSFGAFDPRKGTPRAWIFGIARRVYASYWAAHSHQQHKLQRLAGERQFRDRERAGYPGRRHPRGGFRAHGQRRGPQRTRGREADHGARAELREPARGAAARYPGWLRRGPDRSTTARSAPCDFPERAVVRAHAYEPSRNRGRTCPA